MFYSLEGLDQNNHDGKTSSFWPTATLTYSLVVLIATIKIIYSHSQPFLRVADRANGLHLQLLRCFSTPRIY